jgi:hypothetical protein
MLIGVRAQATDVKLGRRITYQGQLVGFAGDVTMVFSLYDANLKKVWEEGPVVVKPDEKGNFVAVIGGSEKDECRRFIKKCNNTSSACNTDLDCGTTGRCIESDLGKLCCKGDSTCVGGDLDRVPDLDQLDDPDNLQLGIKLEQGGNTVDLTPKQRLFPAFRAASAKLVDPKSVSLSRLADEVARKLVPPGTINAFAGAADRVPDGWLLCDGAAFDRRMYADLFSAIGATWGRGNNSTTFNVPDLRGRFLRGLDQSPNAGRANRDPDATTTVRPYGRYNDSGGNTGLNVGSYQDWSTALPRRYSSPSSADLRTSADGSHSHQYSDAYFSEDKDNASWTGRCTGYDSSETADTHDHDELGSESSKIKQSHALCVIRGRSTYPPSANHSHGLQILGDLESRPNNAYVNWIIKY